MIIIFPIMKHLILKGKEMSMKINPMTFLDDNYHVLYLCEPFFEDDEKEDSYGDHYSNYIRFKILDLIAINKEHSDDSYLWLENMSYQFGASDNTHFFCDFEVKLKHTRGPMRCFNKNKGNHHLDNLFIVDKRNIHVICTTRRGKKRYEHKKILGRDST